MSPRLWSRLPVVLRAVLGGLGMATAGILPWALLGSANLQHGRELPWAALLMAPYLWVYWRWAQGAGWPRSTAEVRRASCRSRALPPGAWGPALLAGVLGIGTAVAFLRVLSRLVRLPATDASEVAGVPPFTLAVSLIMAALVAGVVEEIAFRGYMQRPVERRHGPLVAILVSSTAFALLHFTHREVTWIVMPYILAVAAVYGALAWLTDSILPGLVFHATGNALGFVQVLAGGRGEWQAPPAPPPLVWEAGPDTRFWAVCAATLVLAALAVRAYVALARAVAPVTATGTVTRSPAAAP